MDAEITCGSGQLIDLELLFRQIHTEKRMLCYSIQQHLYQVCSG